MIFFAAPAGLSQVSIEGGSFAVDSGILRLSDPLAALLDAELLALGFVNLGSTLMTYNRVAAGVFTGPGMSDPIVGIGSINISIYAVDDTRPVIGKFVPVRSFDQGATWIPVTALDAPIAFSAFPTSTTLTEPEAGVLYAIRCTDFEGGNARYRMAHA